VAQAPASLTRIGEMSDSNNTCETDHPEVFVIFFNPSWRMSKEYLETGLNTFKFMKRYHPLKSFDAK
jgi:hypothetical protein